MLIWNQATVGVLSSPPAIPCVPLVSLKQSVNLLIPKPWRVLRECMDMGNMRGSFRLAWLQMQGAGVKGQHLTDTPFVHTIRLLRICCRPALDR
jgi:hypothetical protein